MGRALDWLAVALLLAAAIAFALGVRALDREEDRFALYWLAVGAMSLKGSTDLLKPRSAR
jgi:ABC-type branched-subunit amino acid transport system permease subunit